MVSHTYCAITSLVPQEPLFHSFLPLSPERLWMCTRSPARMSLVATPIRCPYLKTGSPLAIGFSASLCPKGMPSRTIISFSSPERTTSASMSTLAVATLSFGSAIITLSCNFADVLIVIYTIFFAMLYILLYLFQFEVILIGESSKVPSPLMGSGADSFLGLHKKPNYAMIYLQQKS